MSDVTYEIQKSPTAHSVVVHVDHLKQYVGRNPVRNWLQNQDTVRDVDQTSVVDPLVDNSHPNDGLRLVPPAISTEDITHEVDQNYPHSEPENVSLEASEIESQSANADISSNNGNDILVEVDDFSPNQEEPPIPFDNKMPNSGATAIGDLGSNTDQTNPGVRTSKRPRKPKILEDFEYY